MHSQWAHLSFIVRLEKDMPIQYTLPQPLNAAKAHSVKESIFYLKKYRAELVWSNLRTFEQSPCSLPQTQTILQGQSVGGISLDALDQVRHLGKAVDRLNLIVAEKRFMLNKDMACELHALAAENEALEWGVFRKSSVKIGGVSYLPPKAEELDALWAEGEKTVSGIENACERAFFMFCHMARCQFFYDGNKRTAWLMMMGELIAHGYLPFAIPAKDAENFNTTLADFYETADASAMLYLLERYSQAQ
jgi:prophage maintenance system killer protein